MHTTDKIGFKLIIREPDMAERTVVVCPRYDGLKLKWSRPSGKMYYQKELSGNIKFWGVDFNTVYGCALRTKFVLLVFDRRKGEIARCEFRKTDCKWDINHCTCDVDVSSWNPYKKIEAGKDNEYNLVKILTEKRFLNFYVYPSSELYIMGDSKLYAFTFGGEKGVAVNVENPTTDGDILSSQFGPVTRGVTRSGYIASGTYAGKYVGETDYADAQIGITDFFYMYRVEGTYAIEFQLVADPIASDKRRRRWDVSLLNITNDTVIKTVTGIKYQYGSDKYPAIATITSINFGTGYPVMQIRCWVPWGRLVSQGEIGPLIIDNIRGSVGKMYYQGRYNFVTISTNEASTGDYKIENTDMYYAPPTNTDEWVPVYTESWYKGISIWASATEVRTITGYTYRNKPWDVDVLLNKEKVQVNDFYTLGDAIKAVLHEIDPDLHFEPDTTHSQFLFSDTNPVSGAQQGKLYISQKSNVLNLGYDYPAWQAPITWGRIETLLNNAFNCYWEIYEKNGERHLRIEHRTYFENGGTYNGSSLAETIDLRSIYRTANRTRLSDKTNRWEWDKDGGSVSSNANRYEYGWMDTQSVIFDGETIEVPESYQLFEDERVEERKVDWFSSDIDFLTSVQAECSSDGFVLVMESLSGNGWIIGGHPNYTGQNYQLSLEYLQPLYLLTGIYSSVVKIGDTEYPNQFTSRMRKAEIDFSLPEGVNIEAGDILWTEVGKGVTETLEQDISSDKWTATVRYENE